MTSNKNLGIVIFIFHEKHVFISAREWCQFIFYVIPASLMKLQETDPVKVSISVGRHWLLLVKSLVLLSM